MNYSQQLKKLIQEGDQVLYEVEALTVGLRETVKAIAEEMELKPSILNKAIKVAHKAKFQEEYDKFDELEEWSEGVHTLLDSISEIQFQPNTKTDLDQNLIKEIKVYLDAKDRLDWK